MSFRWVFSQPDREEHAQYLQEKLGVPSIIAKLLAMRGITTFDDAKLFFRPNIEQLHNPFLMQDMHTAAERMALAIRKTEKVLIYGDYDVDGTTATSIMYLFLSKFGVDVDYYIPHRFKEGYGINDEGIEYAIENDIDLIVSVDCGITAVEEAKVIKKAGIDLIVCDHHNVGDVIPDALAVLDPKRPDCSYPFDGLSGAGVAFKLIQATLTKLGLQPEEAYEYLDLVAISIASDIVPVIDENRIMMRKGLEFIKNNPREGLIALLDLIKVPSSSINTSKIVFSIGPRINAAGRMGDATTAVKLMLSEQKIEAKECATELESVNMKRRDTDKLTLNEALSQIDKRKNMKDTCGIVLYKEDWHLGVIGIVASRLVDIFHRPVIMLSSVEGVIKGSARSIRGFNIYEALRQCEDLLVQFGGHEFAAGLTVKDGKVEEFQARINEIAKCDLSESDFKPELMVDTKLDINEIDLKFWKLLSQFEPFGPSNLRPVFVTEGVSVVGVPVVVGSGHLKMKIKQGNSAAYDVIGFNMHQFLPQVRDADSFDIAYVLEENEWNGKKSLQMRLKDIHLN